MHPWKPVNRSPTSPHHGGAGTEPRTRLLDTPSLECESCPEFSCSFVTKDTVGFTELSRKFEVLSVPTNCHLLTTNYVQALNYALPLHYFYIHYLEIFKK